MNPILDDPRTNMVAELAYTSAALQTMGSCPRWDCSMINYLGTMAVEKAAAAFGAMPKIRKEIVAARREAVEKHGEADPAVKALHDAEAAAEDVHSAKFFAPYESAAIDLAYTPAPTLRAAIFKGQLIRCEELDDLTAMQRDPIEVVAEDFARLAEMANDPATRYHRALDDFNAGQIEETAYSGAYDALNDWEPKTPTDLLRKFLAIFADGASPNDAGIAQLMEQAARIFDPSTGQLRVA